MLNILVIASFIGHGGSIKLPPVLLDRDGAFGCHQFCRTWWVLLATARFNVPVGRLITATFIGRGGLFSYSHFYWTWCVLLFAARFIGHDGSFWLPFGQSLF